MNKRIKKFLDDLESVAPKYQWIMDGPSAIKTSIDGFLEPAMCPIEAVYHARTGKHVLWILAGEMLELEEGDKTLIILAADVSLTNISRYPPNMAKKIRAIRRKMLTILGLEEA